MEAPVQPEAMAPEEIILTAETQQALMEAPEVMQEITEDSREAITIRTVISTDHSYRTPLLSRKNISQFPCGDELLFSIPLVGFILLLVFSFGGTKNKNLKNFARSYFCFTIVVIVLSIIFLGSTIGAAMRYM